MKAFASTLIFTFALGAAYSAFAENPLIREATTLCVANHAEPTKVLAAADAAGWGQSPPVFGGRPAPWWRTKVVAGGTLFLTVKEKDQPSAAGRLRTRTCIVSTDAPGSSGLLAAMTGFLGRPPQQQSGVVSVWVFEETPDGGREFISSDDPEALRRAEARGLARVLSVKDGPAGDPGVLYQEGSLLAGENITASKP